MAKLCLACMFVCANICSSNGALITQNLLSASFFWLYMSAEVAHVSLFLSFLFVFLAHQEIYLMEGITDWSDTGLGIF